MPKLYTIGHSNHSLKEFLDIVQTQRITHIVDVRTIPKSRHFPWFNKESLRQALEEKNIHYLHLPTLGGLRKDHKDSINEGWKNKSFRGFADYMQTNEFFLGLKSLNSLIKKKHRVAIMCAEALPWRCHRSLISDAELVRHYQVWDIFSKTTVKPHQMTSFAMVNKKKRPMQVYYP